MPEGFLPPLLWSPLPSAEEGGGGRGVVHKEWGPCVESGAQSHPRGTAPDGCGDGGEGVSETRGLGAVIDPQLVAGGTQEQAPRGGCSVGGGSSFLVQLLLWIDRKSVV